MDDVIGSADTSSSSVLPDEVLTHIFTFLSLEDRWTVRLTCRSWYDCCASVIITRHEKFVFLDDPPGSVHTTAVVTEVLLRSKSSWLNLNLRGLPLNALPATVWEFCGPRIRELDLYNCLWDDETARNIILHCENLTSLATASGAGHTHTAVPGSLSLLGDFIERGIQRPNLHTLNVVIHHYDDEPLLHKLFQIHPCIKHFGITMASEMPLRLDTFLNQDARLESLRCSTTEWNRFVSMETLVDVHKLGLRLKRLEGSFTCDSTMTGSICTFFKSQTNLEVIAFNMRVVPEDLFYSILESCPNLREFQLSTLVPTVHLKPSQVPRFLALISKLKVFGVHLDSNHCPLVLSMLDSLPDTVQLKLTSLTWLSDHDCPEEDYDPDLCAAFIRRCPSLQHLRMNQCCYDNTLPVIYKYLPKLETLILFHVDTDYRRSCILPVDKNAEGCSMNCLQQLRHLELHRDGGLLMEKTVIELKLPHLEYLYMQAEVFERLSEEQLSHLARHLPNLRVLAIDTMNSPCGDYLRNVIRFCKHSNNLHRLTFHYTYIVKINGMSIGTVSNIFNACPSLRYISAGNFAYMLEPFTETMVGKWCNFSDDPFK